MREQYKPFIAMANETDWWIKHCFEPDGSVRQALGTIGIAKLTAAERQQYYQRLHQASIVAQAKNAAAAAAGQVPQRRDPSPVASAETIDWGGSGASVRTGLQNFALSSQKK